MTKDKFLKRLSWKLRALPKEERQNAIAFYEEYFNDAESEEVALTKLASPDEIAAQLLIEFGEIKRPISKMTMILAILSAPITLPLGISGLLLVLAFVLVLLAFVITLGAMVLSVLMLGVIAVITIIPAFRYNVATGCIYLGISLILFSLTYSFAMLGTYGIRKLTTVIKHGVIKILKRRYQDEK